jgi:two-component system, chemotaxis family, CheB/CheR fusion protein
VNLNPAARGLGLRYGAAVVATLLAAGLRWIVDPVMGPTGEYLTFYFSVLAVTVVAGTGPGVVATALGGLAGTVIFVRLGHVGAATLDDVMRLVLFVLYGATAVTLVFQLRRSEERSGRLEHSAQFPEEDPSPVFRVDMKGRVLYANTSCDLLLPLHGFKRGELIPSPAAEALRPALHAGAARRELVELPGREGRLFSFSSVEVPERQYMNFYGRDVTEERRAKQALETSEARLRAILDNADAMIWLKDRDGRFLVVNRYVERVLDRPADALLGRTVFELFPRDRAAQYAADDRRVLETGQTMEFEEPLDVPGETLIYACIKFPFVNGTGQARGVGAVCTDITRRKRIEEEVRTAKLSAERAKAAAEAANQAKDHFLAVLSHELRTPLSPVLTALILLERETSLSGSGRTYLEVIRRNVELEARLIDDLLDLTRIVRGKVELDRRPVPLRVVIERAVEVCRADLEARRLHFGVRFCPNPGDDLVNADAARLQQVLWNLLKNAIKFTPHGGCVGLDCRRADDHVIVEVSDSGVGIDSTDLPRIFDAFAQAERSTRRHFGGLGLGLAISKSLVEMHGGTIEAESAGADRGSLFRVSLPVLSLAPLPAGASYHASDEGVGSPRHSLRVLLVEDHGDTMQMMVDILQLEGHDVLTAGDVATALKIAAEHPFDVLLSDLGLPDASGLDLIRQLRDQGNTAPAIALSGYGQETDIGESRSAGFHIHLVKPVDPRRLMEAMEAVVTRRH